MTASPDHREPKNAREKRKIEGAVDQQGRTATVLIEPGLPPHVDPV
jgi:hypothetical protein